MLPPLINDLALILICAGIMTLIFKKIKQPIVLGYIVAGFLCSPHLHFTPNVVDTANIHILSEIGVIFLLFALGLDFNIKKIIKNGSTAVIASSAIIFCMIMLGYFLGYLFGWDKMDRIYLGGMMAMSSTTIIYKAFNDMGLKQQKFANVVMSILIVEDILAIVLMIMLSTMAVSHDVEGMLMINNIVKLFFFVVLWFVIGIYLIPILLKYVRSIMSNETLVIISLALCFGMAVFASKVGFSAAFGAFVMGSILSETIEADKIEKLISPVKDLFGAIFFVSVGMMVDPAMIVEYIWPIIIITFGIIIGQAIFGTGGVLLSGQSLKVAMQSSFSLMQIGEFAFIIASLGVSLKVTSDFLYPVVVSVSVITTFLTPYFMKLAIPLYNIADKRLPENIKLLLGGYSKSTRNGENDNNWKKLILAIAKLTVVYSILCVAVILVSLYFLVPFLRSAINVNIANVIALIITLMCMAPFLRAIIMKKNHSKEYKELWRKNKMNRTPLISLIILRTMISLGFVIFVIWKLYASSIALMSGLAIIIIGLMVFSRWLKKQSITLERAFYNNLRIREAHDRYLGKKRPDYESHLLSKDIHISDYTISYNSQWIGKSLRELNLGYKFDVHIISIIRGSYRINIPGGWEKLFPNDIIQIVGTDAAIAVFIKNADSSFKPFTQRERESRDMELVQIEIHGDSQLIGKSLKESRIREDYKCLVVGVECEGDSLFRPGREYVIEKDDVIWVVGEKNNLFRLIGY